MEWLWLIVEKSSVSHRQRLGPGSCRLDQSQDKAILAIMSLCFFQVCPLYLNVHNIRNLETWSFSLASQAVN